MSYQVNGKVSLKSNGYYSCIDTKVLLVKAYEYVFNSEPTFIKNIVVDEDAAFYEEVDSSAKALIFHLYYISPVGGQILLTKSEVFCGHEKLEVNFFIDETSFGTPLYSIISELIYNAGLTNDEVLLSLSETDLKGLECVTCLSRNTLVRFQKAYLLWTELTTMDIPDTYAAASLWEAFISAPDAGTAEVRGRKILFALLAGKISDLSGVFTRSREQFAELLNTSASLFEIEESIAEDETNLDYLDGVRDALLLNSDHDGRYYDGKLIHLIDISYEVKSDLLDSAIANDGLTGIPVTDPPDENLSVAMDIKTISDFVLNYAPFLSAFIAEYGVEIDYFELASSGPSNLETLITTAGTIHPDYSDAAAYADAIYNDLGERQPSARMINALASATDIPSAGAISTLLESNTDFNIRENSAAVFFTTETGQPNTITEELMEDLLTLQRTSNLAGDKTALTTTAALIDLELTSSSAIVNMGEEAFRTALAGTGTISAQTIQQIFNRARSINETAMMMVINYLKYEGPNALVPLCLSGPNLSLPGGALPPNLPDMQKLFGSMNTCTCEHCQSIYSAAAYLTDLLNWLRKDVVHPTDLAKTGLNALETMSTGSQTYDRRKDIRHLLLTCKNTNTLIPYIDIVNEILSVELLIDASYTTIQITDARKSLQTTKTTEEIMIQPEHRFHAAENLLKQYFYTWKLPYNVPFDEVHSYTEISGMSYQQVVSDFSPANLKYDQIRWALSCLNINPEELPVFTATNSASASFWLDFWGSASAITTAGPVLKTTELSVNQLKDELNAYYINGTSKIEVIAVDDLCDVDSYTFSPSFTAAIAERLMKFFRLRRKAGLSVWEMDVAISTLGGGTIDNAFIQKLAASIEFSKKHAIPFSDILVMAGNNAYPDIVTASGTDFSEYYILKFKNPLLPGTLTAFFNASPYASDITLLSAEQKQFVATALNTNIHVIDQIISDLSLNGSFTSTVLATIHRHVLLLKVFAIDHAEMSTAISFFGDIFNASNIIKEAFNFSEKLARFRTLKTPLLTFVDIVNATGDNSASSPTLIAKAEKSWKSTEKAFQEARKANSDKDAANSLWLAFYKGILVKDIALQFDLIESDVESIIDEYSSTWFADFINDPDGITTTRNWTNKENSYKPVYRLFNRIVQLAGIFGIEKVVGDDNLEKQSLVYAVEAEIDGTRDVPGTSPFYWIKNDYTPLTASRLSELIWIKHASKHAATMDIRQRDDNNSTRDFYFFIDNYYNDTPPYGEIAIKKLYDSLGESPYKKLTIHEFTSIFDRAVAIAPVTGDIVSVLDCFETIYNVTKVFNIKVADAWGWIWTSAWSGGTFTTTTIDYNISADIKRTINGKFPATAEWSKVIVPVQNGLRSRMRDAFVGLYIAERGFENENELYRYYLLDTQMAPCMKTSRIVQAIASVQLLVHRGLLNLEPNLFIDENDKLEWQWRKNYRVWEANRKVFLYPENWIEPTLRKNKTQLFKAAEELLLQDEINDRNCEQAYSGYLNGLNDVAHLDIRAVYVEDPKADLRAGGGMVYKNNRDEIYHAFARNWNPPYTYYYRKFEDGVWQGWEKMDIEIESDHLIPVMFNRKIYLFFPMFKEKMYEWPDPNNKHFLKYYEISLAYTKLDFGKWSQKKIFNEKLNAYDVVFANGAFIDDPTAKADKHFSRFWFGGVNLGNSYVLSGPPDGHAYAGNYYAFASMEMKDFYFWGENLSNGGLKIHCRRAFNKKHPDTNINDSYTEFAFELGFSINPVDERAEIVGAYEIHSGNETSRFALARPYMTVPWYQQMKYGKAYGQGSGPAKLFTKLAANGSNQSSYPLLGNSSNYTLTFPQQFRDSYFKQPFFFHHSKRNYFFRHYHNANPTSNTA